MTLYAFDSQLAAERSTATIFNHIATLTTARGFTDKTVFGSNQLLLQPVNNFHRAISGDTLFIASDKKCDTPMMIWVLGDKLLNSHYHSGQRAFHIGSTTSVQLSISFSGLEGWIAPMLFGTSRHNISMSGKT